MVGRGVFLGNGLHDEPERTAEKGQAQDGAPFSLGGRESRCFPGDGAQQAEEGCKTQLPDAQLQTVRFWGEASNDQDVAAVEKGGA